MKKLLFAILTVTVMLTSGVTMGVDAKEKKPVVTEAKETKTKKSQKKQSKVEKEWENRIIDYIEHEYDTYVESIEIVHMNRKGTKVDFSATDVKDVDYSGSVELDKFLWMTTSDWTIGRTFARVH